jgi:hypothetical protein
LWVEAVAWAFGVVPGQSAEELAVEEDEVGKDQGIVVIRAARPVTVWFDCEVDVAGT